TGSGSVGGNALSGLTNRDRSQSSHRNAQHSSLGTIVGLSSSDCINLNSAPHAIQRIALPANSGSSYCQVVLVGGRDLWRSTKTYRCSNTSLQCLTLLGTARILKIGGIRSQTSKTLSSAHYRSATVGVSHARLH